MSPISGGAAGLSFSYDANGNLALGIGRSYAWTSYNQARDIDKLSGGTAVQRTSFIFGPEHQRTRQTVSPMSGGVPGAPTTTIYYAGAIEKEIDTAANTTTIRTYLPQGRNACIGGDRSRLTSDHVDFDREEFMRLVSEVAPSLQQHPWVLSWLAGSHV